MQPQPGKLAGCAAGSAAGAAAGATARSGHSRGTLTRPSEARMTSSSPGSRHSMHDMHSSWHNTHQPIGGQNRKKNLRPAAGDEARAAACSREALNQSKAALTRPSEARMTNSSPGSRRSRMTSGVAVTRCSGSLKSGSPKELRAQDRGAGATVRRAVQVQRLLEVGVAKGAASKVYGRLMACRVPTKRSPTLTQSPRAAAADQPKQRQQPGGPPAAGAHRDTARPEAGRPSPGSTITRQHRAKSTRPPRPCGHVGRRRAAAAAAAVQQA